MTNNILARETKTIKGTALSMINTPDMYTKEEIKEVYNNLSNDKRLSNQTRITLLNGLMKVYKRK